jgi:hypothetical protein
MSRRGGIRQASDRSAAPLHVCPVVEEITMKTIRIAAFMALVIAGATHAQEADHTRGDHPAVVIQRLQAQQTYDYAAQFYPHPAWLYLQAEAPRPMMDHPAVIIARQQREAQQAAETAPDRFAARLR